MRATSLIGLISIAFLTSCAAKFGSHLDNMKSAGSLSVSGKSQAFIISDSGSETQKIDYAYSKIISDYSEYTKNMPTVEDTTKKLISARLLQFGMMSSSPSTEMGFAKFSYKQILGWDMGEIVKQMTICAETNVDTVFQMECASFSELKMVNSHPTRKIVVDNLLAILLTLDWPENAPPEKYSKTINRPQKS